MKNTKKWLLILLPMLWAALAGCSMAGLPQGNTPSSSGESLSPTDPPEGTDASIAAPSQSETPPDGSSGEKTAVLYIGTRSGGFTEYSMSYEGELTPETLIQGIADLTGWNLSLAETVATGRGGMSVCLADESSLYMGPPDPQKDEFHVFDGMQLAEMILDSIQKTLQEGFTGEGGNPDALDIYFYMKGEKPLELPDLGLSWPLDQPYMWKTPDQQP